MTQLDGDRQLITFALFAYNQENYIREAVLGAFSQTYEPLEIILSDDCSDDRTFAIMQEMVDAYDGPHQVRAVQTKRNLGVTSHVILRGREAKGEIVVVAAGDDISKPDRCAAHVASYQDPTVMAVSSGYDMIDENAKLIQADVLDPLVKGAMLHQLGLFQGFASHYVVIQGSTASYRQQLFSFPMPPNDMRFAEDNFFNFLIYANGSRVEKMPCSLIKYRAHSNAVSNFGLVKRSASEIEIFAHQDDVREYYKLKAFRWIVDYLEDSSRVNRKELKDREQHAKAKYAWPETGFPERLFSLALSLAARDIRAAKWKVLRIFGKFPMYQPKMVGLRIVGRYR